MKRKTAIEIVAAVGIALVILALVLNKKEKVVTRNDASVDISPTATSSAYLQTNSLSGGWEVLASTTIDYNKDGLPDAIVVAEDSSRMIESPLGDQVHPRRLTLLEGVTSTNGSSGTFKIAGTYDNAVRYPDEGGQLGDPFENLTSVATSFTVTYSGGGGWDRWEQDYTFTFIHGRWQLAEVIDIGTDNWEKNNGYLCGYKYDFMSSIKTEVCNDQTASKKGGIAFPKKDIYLEDFNVHTFKIKEYIK